MPEKEARLSTQQTKRAKRRRRPELDHAVDTVFLANTEMTITPIWGIRLDVNAPYMARVAPGRGVVGQYIDRRITSKGLDPAGRNEDSTKPIQPKNCKTRRRLLLL